MRFTVYRTTNTINGKVYVGCHRTEDPHDGYLGSGLLLKKAVKKYGKAAFKKEILHDFDTAEEMLAAEGEIVDADFLARDDTYNLAPGGSSPFVNMTAKELRAISKKGHDAQRHLVRTDPDFKARRLEIAREGQRRLRELGLVDPGAAFRGRSHTPETKAKMRAAMKVTSAGERNSQFGTYWVRKGGSEKKVPAEEFPKWAGEGWERGRTKRAHSPSPSPTRGTCWICHATENPRRVSKTDLPLFIRKGWRRGRKF